MWMYIYDMECFTRPISLCQFSLIFRKLTKYFILLTFNFAILDQICRWLQHLWQFLWKLALYHFLYPIRRFILQITRFCNKTLRMKCDQVGVINLWSSLKHHLESWPPIWVHCSQSHKEELENWVYYKSQGYILVRAMVKHHFTWLLNSKIESLNKYI